MASGRFSTAQAPVSLVHTNTDQEIIQITDDKLRLILNDHLRQMERKKDWIAPLGIVIAVSTVFASAEFKDGLGLKAASWQAIFVIAGLLSTAWLVIAVIQAITSPTIEEIVGKIKNSRAAR